MKLSAMGNRSFPVPSFPGQNVQEIPNLRKQELSYNSKLTDECPYLFSNKYYSVI